MPATDHRQKLLIVASERSRTAAASPLLRLVRDHRSVLQQFHVHTTEGTGKRILSTGLYSPTDIVYHLAGRNGGVAQLAAMVVRSEIAAAILLLDPSDPWSDAVENRALKRVCIQLQTRLLTTYAAAVRWLSLEAPSVLESPLTQRPVPLPRGTKNVSDSGDPIPLPISKRTMALISHDKKKLEMVHFSNEHSSLLARHERILTTGTTGTVLTLLFGDEEIQAQVLGGVKTDFEERIKKILQAMLKEAVEARLVKGRETGERLDEAFELEPKTNIPLKKMIEILRVELKLVPNVEFARRIFPLPSGPFGGDVLIADIVLKNECHSIVFLHDPTTSHPHNDDIRLLEHTSQLPGVFAECVSDRQSAEQWSQALDKQERAVPQASMSIAHELRLTLRGAGVREVVVVDRIRDEDGPELGREIARVCAGYFNQRIREIVENKKNLRIGIAWGWGSMQVLSELRAMKAEGVIDSSERFSDSVVWSPLIGSIGARFTDREATFLAEEFRDFFGGELESFSCAGFAARETSLPVRVRDLIGKLHSADIVVTAAAPWNEDAALLRETGLSPKFFPGFDEAVGLISGVFLRDDGTKVEKEYGIVGLDWEGFRDAAIEGDVILMCGGLERRRTLLAALRARLFSVLVTSSDTARWLLATLQRERQVSDLS